MSAPAAPAPGGGLATAVASAVIDRPIDVVRAQLFDMDHAIRARIVASSSG